MTRLHSALLEARTAGRLGLGIYALPFPTLQRFRGVLSALQELEFVSLVETAVPAPTGFSPHTNDTIARALRVGSDLQGWDEPLRGYKLPLLCILYRGAVDAFGYDPIVEQVSEWAAGVIVEWDESDLEKYVAAPRRKGVEAVQSVGPWMSDAEIARVLSFSSQDALVYLMAAPMTGAALYPALQLRRCAEAAKRSRPDVMLLAGFGVRCAEDIRHVAAVEAIDGVVVGTAFIESVERGTNEAISLIRSFSAALAR